MRILVTGSRDWPTVAEVWSALEQAAAGGPITVVHGACPTGADRWALYWTRHRKAQGVVSEPHPANWDSCTWACPTGPRHRRRKQPGDRHHPGMLDDYCPGAGPRRNAHMVQLGADLVLAFPLGRSAGTRGCMRLAAAAGIPVKEYTP